MELLLTDDELVAVAAHEHGCWPAALPTVDITDEDELRAALWRGRRSLAVRRLLDDAGGLADGPLRRVAAATRCDWFLDLYLGDAGGTRASWSGSHRLFPPAASAGTWLVNEVTEPGIHRFSTGDQAAVTQFLRSFGEGLLTATGGGKAPDRSGCVLRSSRHGDLVMAVRRGQVELVDVPDGGPVVKLATVDLDAALQRLLA